MLHISVPSGQNPENKILKLDKTDFVESRYNLLINQLLHENYIIAPDMDMQTELVWISPIALRILGTTGLIFKYIFRVLQIPLVFLNIWKTNCPLTIPSTNQEPYCMVCISQKGNGYTSYIFHHFFFKRENLHIHEITFFFIPKQINYFSREGIFQETQLLKVVKKKKAKTKYCKSKQVYS